MVRLGETPAMSSDVNLVWEAGGRVNRSSAEEDGLQLSSTVPNGNASTVLDMVTVSSTASVILVPGSSVRMSVLLAKS